MPNERLILYAGILVVAIALDLLVLKLWRRDKSLVEQVTAAASRRARSVWKGLAGYYGSLRSTASGLVTHVRSEWRGLLERPELVLRASILVGCLFVTASIGILYAGQLVVDGWQLWLWLVCCAVAITSAAPSWPSLPTLSRRHLYLLAIVVAALGIRLLALQLLPATLHVDEAGTAHLTLTHVPAPDGATLFPFRYGYNWQPALFHYLQRLAITVLGASSVAIRVPGILGGVLAVLATYFVIRTFDDSTAALLGAGIVATSHYHIHWSLLALNNVWDTLWVPVMIGGFAWAWQWDEPWGAILAGSALGLSQHFYAGSKIGALLLLLLMVHLWRDDPGEAADHRLFKYGGITLLLGAVIAAPILIFAISDPSAYLDRARDVFYWETAVLEGSNQGPGAWLRGFWEQFTRSLGGFTSLPDQTGFMGGGLPFTLGLAAPLLAGGVLWSLYRKRWLPVVWLGLTAFIGGFLLTATPSSSHFVVAIPAIAWIVALALRGLWRHGHPTVALVVFGLIILTDLVYYFGFYLPAGASPHLDVPFPSPPA